MRHKIGIHHVFGQRGPGPAGRPYRRHRQNLDPQTVARLRPLHRNRPVHRVRAIGDLAVVPVPAIGVDGFRDHRVAAGHGQGRRHGAQNGVP